MTFFMKDPFTGFYLREVARELNMSPMTVKRSIELLIEDGLLESFREKNLLLFKGNTENPAFRFHKIAFNLSYLREDPFIVSLLMENDGLISVVLYGSVAKGTDTPDSDIDLLIISTERNGPLGRVPITQGRELSITVMRPDQWATEANRNRAFYIELIRYGIPLYGNVPVV